MPHVLALDVGGTKVAAGLVGTSGTLSHKDQTPTQEAAGDSLYDRLLRLARNTLHEASGPVKAIGVGCGGPAKNAYELVSPLHIPEWDNFPLREKLENDLQISTHVDNDAKALALAEGWVGTAKNYKNFLAMVVSTGVGGGIVLNGTLLEGADGNAGHIGHIYVDSDGGEDANGVSGLLEGSASGSALHRILGTSASNAGDETRKYVGELVGRAVASVANLLDLQLAVVSGSVALGFGNIFFEAAQKEIDQLSRIEHARGTRIVPSELAADGPLIGAGAVGWRALGKEIL
tara:strand:+ start:56 stop:925 length:870 start_codon:yes stop_codon:yes gene_type:complete